MFSIVQSLGIGAAALVSYSASLVMYRLYFHSLAKFPGPKLAAATHFYEIYYDLIGKTGEFIWEIQRMHELYGPIVRINPDELHIRDPDFYDVIYCGASHKRDKYKKWEKMSGAPLSAFGTTDHDLHRSRRAALNPFFAKRSIVRLESRISDKVAILCDRFSKVVNTEQLIELNAAYFALTLDIIEKYCFGNDTDNLLMPDFNEPWKNSMSAMFENAAFRRMAPWLGTVLESLPHSLLMKLVPPMAILVKWEIDLYKQIDTIIRTDKEKRKESIFKDLLDNQQLPPVEKSAQRLANEASVLVSAGSETTAKTLAHTTYYILGTPGVLSKLRAELDSVMPSADLLSWTELEQLPYLKAVIAEGLRLSMGISSRLPRAPHEPLRYGEWVIPAWTIISQSTPLISTLPHIFPDPEAFRPERWMNTNGERLDRYLTNFCKGTRGCLGINLAYAELFLAIAAIFRRFDLELYETTIDDVKMSRDGFVPMPQFGSKGIRIFVRWDRFA